MTWDLESIFALIVGAAMLAGTGYFVLQERRGTYAFGMAGFCAIGTICYMLNAVSYGNPMPSDAPLGWLLAAALLIVGLLGNMLPPKTSSASNKDHAES
jgi:peptidoglycan/LPS O-acetylase OafA/YrhL